MLVLMQHVAVWLDHKEAQVFHVDGAEVDKVSIQAPRHHVHHEKGTKEHGHPSDALHYYQRIATALSAADSILILGPSTAKLELIRHLHQHDLAVSKKVVGVETVDHPTSKQIVAYARSYFVASDRMQA